MVDPRGTRRAAAALVVSPMAAHRILATPDLVTYFIEPHCLFADRLRQRYAPGIAAAPELVELSEHEVAACCAGPSKQLDARLVTALATLSDRGVLIPDLAAQIGLSPQRLRALARRDLGMPLSRWRVWSRLRRAVHALQSGVPLAHAATIAGFADQAHFSRQMREMMGLTPTVVQRALSDVSLPVSVDQPLRAT